VFLDKLTHAEAEAERIAFLPDVDFVETPREYRLYLSVPGLVEEDIDLAIGERSLTVRGERQPPYDPTHSQRRLGEWRYGFFERRLQLPHPIRTDAVRASCDAGVLTVVLPKAARR
jgi:HSP20 family protein